MVRVCCRIVVLFIALATVSAPVAAPSAEAWQFTATGDGNVVDDALAVAFNRSSAGHVIAAGLINNEVFAVKLHKTQGHSLWTFHLPQASGGSGMARAVAVDAAEHVILAGVTAGGGGQFTVIKLDSETGVPHWIRIVGVGDAFSVAVDAAGDVIAAGVLEGGMGAVKLRGTDGTEIWRALPQGVEPGGQVRALAVDPSGDAVVAGSVRDAPFRSAFAVVKLTGSDGSERWRHVIATHPFSGGGEQAVAVALDGAGDVVAAGTVRVFKESENRLRREFTVVKLAGSDGALRWRRDAGSGNDNVRAMALDAAGDVVAVGSIGFESAVVKLSGVDGSDVWRRVGDAASADTVDVDAAESIVVGGVAFAAAPESTRFDAVVRRLSGVTGAEIWSTVLNGPGNNDDMARAVAFDGESNVVMVGQLVGAATGPDFAVVKLSGTNGSNF
jgi:hypothetical protein